MFERFTDRARRVVVLAQEEARDLGHNHIGTEHVLLGLIQEGEGVGAKALEALGISLRGARARVEEIVGKGGQATIEGNIPFTPRAKRVLELSLRESLQLGHNYIGTEHVLLGLAREGQGVAAQVLVRLGISLDDLRTTVIGLLTGGAVTPRPPDRLDLRRFSPGLLSALEAAQALASGHAAVGTHHVLSVLAEWDDVAAHGVLQAGGFDPAQLETPIADWDVSGTRDETEEEWGRRVTEVETDEEAVVVRFVDPVLRLQVLGAIESGAGDDVNAAFGRALRDVGTRIPMPREDHPTRPDDE
jgi:ATP-dependent Clp protease ATP-binding subunit ClpA